MLGRRAAASAGWCANTGYDSLHSDRKRWGVSPSNAAADLRTKSDGVNLFYLNTAARLKRYLSSPMASPCGGRWPAFSYGELCRSNEQAISPTKDGETWAHLAFFGRRHSAADLHPSVAGFGPRLRIRARFAFMTSLFDYQPANLPDFALAAWNNAPRLGDRLFSPFHSSIFGSGKVPPFDRSGLFPDEVGSIGKVRHPCNVADRRPAPAPSPAIRKSGISNCGFSPTTATESFSAGRAPPPPRFPASRSSPACRSWSSRWRRLRR